MVPRHQVLLVVSADRREFAGFGGPRNDLTPVSFGVRWSARANLNGCQALLVANGPGGENAAQGVEFACKSFDVGAVVSAGYVGALDPELTVGSTLIVRRIIQLKPRLEYAVRLPACSGELHPRVAVLLTVDEVAQDARRKAQLWVTGAAAVDMEASAVAAEASRRGLPFYCLRAVSDEADTSLIIDWNRARRMDGTFSGWNILAQAAARPWRWKQLRDLLRDGRRASAALGRLFQQCRFDFDRPVSTNL